MAAAGVSSIPRESLEGCTVRTEFRGSSSIIDILVYKPGDFLIYIENKTVSPEGIEQVDREYRDMRQLGQAARVPDSRMFPIFLTPSGRAPISGDPSHWHSLSYTRLAREIETLLPELKGRKIAYFLEDLIHHYDGWSIS